MFFAKPRTGCARRTPPISDIPTIWWAIRRFRRRFGDYLVNNLGDPYAGSHYASHACDLEREAVAWLMDLWQCDDREKFWGSVVASGTEGNIWALYLAREAFPTAQTALQPRGALLDPEGRAHPAHGVRRGRLRDGRRHRRRGIRESARCARRKSRRSWPSPAAPR